MFSLTFTTKCQDLHHQGPPPPSPPPTVAPDPLPFPSPHNAARGASASISWFRFYGSNPNDFYDYGGPYKGGPYNGRSAALVRIVHRGFYGPRLRWSLGAVGRSALEEVPVAECKVEIDVGQMRAAEGKRRVGAVSRKGKRGGESSTRLSTAKERKTFKQKTIDTQAYR